MKTEDELHQALDRLEEMETYADRLTELFRVYLLGTKSQKETNELIEHFERTATAMM